MPRTVISLDEDDKRWLDERARREGVPMTEIIRRIVRLLRARGGNEPTTEELLERTQGVWRHGDGLRYQERLRDDWE